MTFFNNLVSIFLEAAPWLLLGFIAAGLIKAWIPKDGLQRWLGGKGLWTVTKAAIIGAPLPLCSCGVLPAATELHRNGASRSSTVSFLISTPETGVDSIALSYVLLGPVMAIIRPIAAVGSAIITGLITALVPDNKIENNEVTCADSHCGCSNTVTIEIEQQESSCCSSSACNEQKTPGNSFITRTWSGLRYALVDMVDDLILWLSIGLILAAIISTIFPPMAMAEWGSGLSAMLLMLLIGVPMYICATASTPIAASLIMAGVSPGTVLVFLLAGPATNIATIGVIQKEMGKGVVIAYLSGISICSIMFGYLTDWYINYNDFNVMSQMTEASEWMPEWIAQFSAIILLLASANILLNRARGLLLSTTRQEE
ncbi:MAG: SO_0444 family Cu/Zn efflux transporter [Gammaproteobacteria bacterium]|nr:SO_0444 family Cu/Zn efflux transporter [Gammaproteobacteria bacterium]